MAEKTDFPKILWPAIELIQQQQAVINALVAKVNEMAEMLGCDGLDVAGGYAPAPVPTSAKPETQASAKPEVKKETAAAAEPVSVADAQEEEGYCVSFYEEDGIVYFNSDTMDSFPDKYVLKLGKDRGSFTVNDEDEEFQSEFVSGYKTLLEKIAQYDAEPPKYPECRDYVVKNIAPGVLSLRGGKWEVVQKAKIAFEKKEN